MVGQALEIVFLLACLISVSDAVAPLGQPTTIPGRYRVSIHLWTLLLVCGHSPCLFQANDRSLLPDGREMAVSYDATVGRRVFDLSRLGWVKDVRCGNTTIAIATTGGMQTCPS